MAFSKIVSVPTVLSVKGKKNVMPQFTTISRLNFTGPQMQGHCTATFEHSGKWYKSDISSTSLRNSSLKDISASSNSAVLVYVSKDPKSRAIRKVAANTHPNAATAKKPISRVISTPIPKAQTVAENSNVARIGTPLVTPVQSRIPQSPYAQDLVTPARPTKTPRFSRAATPAQSRAQTPVLDSPTQIPIWQPVLEDSDSATEDLPSAAPNLGTPDALRVARTPTAAIDDMSPRSKTEATSALRHLMIDFLDIATIHKGNRKFFYFTGHDKNRNLTPISECLNLNQMNKHRANLARERNHRPDQLLPEQWINQHKFGESH